MIKKIKNNEKNMKNALNSHNYYYIRNKIIILFLSREQYRSFKSFLGFICLIFYYFLI